MAGTIIAQRMTAEVDGDFVVFLIGTRINKPWKILSWWPVIRAMRSMLKELDANPDLGCLGYTFGWPVIENGPMPGWPMRPVSRWQFRIAFTLSTPALDWFTPCE